MGAVNAATGLHGVGSGTALAVGAGISSRLSPAPAAHREERQLLGTRGRAAGNAPPPRLELASRRKLLGGLVQVCVPGPVRTGGKAVVRARGGRFQDSEVSRRGRDGVGLHWQTFSPASRRCPHLAHLSPPGARAPTDKERRGKEQRGMERERGNLGEWRKSPQSF